MKLISVSVRSNFIDSGPVTAFHAAMYHGIASRNGIRFPNDDPPQWDQEVNPLELAVNIHSNSQFFVPGYYPVVKCVIGEKFVDYPGVQLGRVDVTTCIDIPWSIAYAPELHQDPEALFDDPQNQCPCPNPGPQLVELIMRQIPQSHNAKNVVIDAELGTPPLEKHVSISVPEDWISDKFVFASGSNFFFDKESFDGVRNLVPAEFFVIREIEIFR